MTAEEETTESPQKEKRPTQRQRARAALPAVYIDTWSIVWWNSYLRVSFAEWLYKEPNYRFAAVLELDDAQRLGEHLLEMVAKARAEREPDEADQSSTDEVTSSVET